MHDIETHTEDYLVLVPEGRGLMEEYTPPDWLGGVMNRLKERWFGYVNALCERCEHTNVHTHVHTCTCMHMYMYIHTCAYIHIHVHICPH